MGPHRPLPGSLNTGSTMLFASSHRQLAIPMTCLPTRSIRPTEVLPYGHVLSSTSRPLRTAVSPRGS